MRLIHLILLCSLFVSPTIIKAQQTYFPPLIGQEWQTTNPESLGWCEDSIQSLFDYLQSANSKAFIVLKEGKMVVEKYFGTFTQDSAWYWASAGKTLTAALIGIAQDEGLIDINQPSNTYLGNNWSSLSQPQEDSIKVLHHLDMTTGLNYQTTDLNCKSPACLTYKSTPGSEWFYYNAPYLLLQDMIEKTSGQTLQSFTFNRIGLKTGVVGLWNDGVFFSRPRAMARFGLLMANHGVWNNDSILKNQDFVQALTQTSQNHNLAYGYLWWLNGKNNFKLPLLTQTFPGKLIPNAPDDMVAAMGKNDQRIYIVPSQQLVVIRMGNEAGEPAAGPSSFDNLLWKKISQLSCEQNSLPVLSTDKQIQLYPNPVTNQAILSEEAFFTVYNALGKKVLEGFGNHIPMQTLDPGSYTVLLVKQNNVYQHINVLFCPHD